MAMAALVHYPACRVLVRFREAFGGAIHRGTDGRGLRKPSIRWDVNGQEGKQAANMLAATCMVKHDQLLMASTWPLVRSTQMASSRTIAGLKLKQPTPPNVQCSWAYIAGFFDAEGCITLLATHSSTVLTLGQSTEGVLLSVRDKMQDVCRSVLSVQKASNNSYKLQVSTHDDAIAVLQRLLISGLLLKRRQAEAVLTLEARSHMHIREQLTGLKGNQMRYSRLDAAGCARARAIAKVSAKLTRLESRGKVEEAAPVQELLAKMRQEHALLTLRTAYCLLRADIRAGLAEGAQHTCCL